MKPDILILGSSSFLTKPIINRINQSKLFTILCLSHSKIKKNSNISNVKQLRIDYSVPNIENVDFTNCKYIVNLVNTYLLTRIETLNFRKFLKNVLSISSAKLLHISSVSVYGPCKDNFINEDSNCIPKSKYQIIKKEEEIALIDITNKLSCDLFLFRPTQIIGEKSINCQSLIKACKSKNFLKKYFFNSFYSNRPMHFVTSNFLAESIVKVIFGGFPPGIYLISQDLDKENNYVDICKMIEFKIFGKRRNLYQNLPNIPLKLIFIITYKLFRRNEVKPFAKFISRSPIIESNNYKSFKKDFLEYLDNSLN